MIDAGHMDYAVAFDRPVKEPDGAGGTETRWSPPEDAVKAYAKFRYLRGGETVQAARLSGRQPAVVTVYSTEASRQITPAWRMRDERSGEIYNIRSVIPTDDRAFLELTVERGVAVGTPMEV